MKIDPEEIKRIIDDFETKAEEAEQKSVEASWKGFNTASFIQQTKAETLQYCVTVLRQVLIS
jgi:hypothetical protein